MPVVEPLEKREVITAFLRHQGKILLVKRSEKVGSYQGYWSAISGYLEDPTPLAQARREIREETGLEAGDFQLIRSGTPLEIPSPEHHCCWVVHPFLFDIKDPRQIRLDWENNESSWVEPHSIGSYKTVPMLQETYRACMVEQ
jgi:8-oxo-dGTP pyrophosphatase MutT (NUDIX family)